MLDDAGLLDDHERHSNIRSESRYRYPWSLGWSEKMQARMDAYAACYERFVDLETERQSIESQLEKEKVSRLWDEA